MKIISHRSGKYFWHFSDLSFCTISVPGTLYMFRMDSRRCSSYLPSPGRSLAILPLLWQIEWNSSHPRLQLGALVYWFRWFMFQQRDGAERGSESIAGSNLRFDKIALGDPGGRQFSTLQNTYATTSAQVSLREDFISLKKNYSQPLFQLHSKLYICMKVTFRWKTELTH